QLDDMAATGADAGWTVLADITTATAPMRVGVGFADGGTGRDLRVDGAPARGFEKISMALPQLWLTPAMDRLFTDSAGGRRRFIDRFAQTLVPGLSTQLNQYERAMRERNKLLQTPGTQFSGNGWLDGLEENMASLGTAIAAARLAALDALAEGLAAMPETVFPRAEVALEGTLEAVLRAQPAIEVEDGWRARLQAERARDAAAGRSLEGPHRTDLHVTHAAKNMAAAKCSTGEQKGLLVGLIMAQARSVAARTGDVPILLLDEVAAHLDATRRQALFEILQDLGGQSWITGTDATAFADFTHATSHLHIAAGAVLPGSGSQL
ncbi:MAG: DNA replication and repair protein RecF, partial [Pseudomonadota bacterium]|nr:DNA replication and repair protein RecF [Pseudomonadota bacterium]